MEKAIVVIVVALCISFVSSQTFRNPILDRDAPDPWILRYNGAYLMTFSHHDNITVYQSDRLDNWRNARAVAVYIPVNKEYVDLWAPEIHVIKNELYIYFTAATNTPVVKGHRMYVLKANKAADPLGSWTWLGQIKDADRDWWAIDGTVFQHQNLEMYFIWAGHWGEGTSGTVNGAYLIQMLIAKMSNATTLVANSTRVLNRPVEPWETNGDPGRGGVSEGPAVIDSGINYYVMYSGSSTWTDDYCLGMLRINKTADPMNPDSWYKYPLPVFQKNVKDSVFGPGHASFTVSPDGSENWMVYHAMEETFKEGNRRTARVQRFWIQDDGTPVFPRAEGYSKELKLPSTSSASSFGTGFACGSFFILVVFLTSAIMTACA